MKFGFALISSLALLFSALPGGTFEPRPLSADVLQVGDIRHGPIREDSGIVASRRQPGVFWTHTDGGKNETLYAIDRSGKLLGEFRVSGAALSDWEDIAIDGEGRIYLGDLGNNLGTRSELKVLQVEEPNLAESGSRIQVRQSWRLVFPGKGFDCESLFVWRETGYVISKVSGDKRAVIYSFPLADTSGTVVLKSVVTLPVTSPVTGADLTANGEKLGLVCKAGAFVFEIGGDVARAGQVTPSRTRFNALQIEGCTFVPEGLLATAESRQVLLFTAEAYRP